MTERISREKVTHTDDVTKPINAKQLMANDKQIHGESCFGEEWNPQDSRCAICHDSDFCSIAFHYIQKKRVKEFEKNNPITLDVNDFDGINKNELFIWLGLKHRTFKQLIEKVDGMANCEDYETVRLYCKSFIMDSPKLSVKEGVVIVKN